MSEVETKLFILFSDFIRDISKVFPEIKNSLYRNYEDCLVESDNKCLSDFPKVKRFLELLERTVPKIVQFCISLKMLVIALPNIPEAPNIRIFIL